MLEQECRRLLLGIGIFFYRILWFLYFCLLLGNLENVIEKPSSNE